MACINPIELKTGDIVPCGYCNFCLQLKRMDWCFRLSEEQRDARSAYFITLTYSPECLPSHGDLVPDDHKNFLKRLRKFQEKLFDGLLSIRYFMAAEYGEIFGRPHYHYIIFNLIPQTVNALEKIWGKGRVDVGSCTGASIGYVTSYCINRFNYPGREPPFSRMSRKPGLGANYLSKKIIRYHVESKVSDVSRNGVSAHMPRYYRHKIFDDSQRRELRKVQLLEMETTYDRDIKRLKRFHSNPYYYYDERRRCAHEQINSQLKYTL
ncbi:MAG: replication initiator protein [Microviridae sp.]|nr:MAG: replication initiator protein [Microviridae sp.]